MWFENNPGRSPSLDGKSGRTSNIWIQDKLIAVHFPLFSWLDFCYGLHEQFLDFMEQVLDFMEQFSYFMELVLDFMECRFKISWNRVFDFMEQV